jgi:hypothetical protein
MNSKPLSIRDDLERGDARAFKFEAVPENLLKRKSRLRYLFWEKSIRRAAVFENNSLTPIEATSVPPKVPLLA